jgi:cysteine synthase A
MIEDAERAQKLKPGAIIVEATSGNTGISLAMISATRGYRCVLVMPEDMSLERRYLLRAYGAEIELTNAELGMAGAVQRAAQIAESRNGFMPSQFENPANPKSHEETTAVELLEQAPNDLRAFVAGVGTGGTVSGVGRVIKAKLGSTCRIIAVEPASSPVLSGGRPAMHGIQGLGAGFVPKIYDASVVDEVRAVSDSAAQRMAKRLAEEEGLMVGPSSGANVHAACEVAAQLTGGHVITLLCDTGERYLF